MTSGNSAPTHPSQWWGGRRTLLLLAFIVIAAGVIRLQAFGGYVGTDDDEYAHFAHAMATGSGELSAYEGPAVFPLRVGIIAPAAVMFRAFGLSEWTLALYPLLLSLLGIVLAFVCASLRFGHRAGLIGAALVSVFPWDIDGATRLWPDLPAAFYAAAAGTTILYLVVRGSRAPSRLFIGGAIAGVLLGFSWLSKESVAYLAPFCFVWMLLTVKREGRPMVALWGGVAAGSLAILLGEMITYQITVGDFLFRVHETNRNYAQWPNGFFSEGSNFGWTEGTSYTSALLDRLFVSGPRVILLNRTFLYLPLLGLAATIYAWFRRDRAYLIPALWLWSLVLMFNFGSSSTSSYLPLALYNRYLSPVFFPAIVIVAGFLATTLFPSVESRSTRGIPLTRLAGAGAALFIGYVAASELWLKVRNPSRWLEDVKAAQQFVTPSTVLYSDGVTLRALRFYHGYPAQTAWRDLQSVTAPEQLPPGSLVLIYPPGIQWLDRNAGMWVKWPQPGLTDRAGYLRGHFYKTPPATWAPVWEQRDVRLFRVRD